MWLSSTADGRLLVSASSAVVRHSADASHCRSVVWHPERQGRDSQLHEGRCRL